MQGKDERETRGGHRATGRNFAIAAEGLAGTDRARRGRPHAEYDLEPGVLKDFLSHFPMKSLGLNE